MNLKLLIGGAVVCGLGVAALFGLKAVTDKTNKSKMDIENMKKELIRLDQEKEKLDREHEESEEQFKAIQKDIQDNLAELGKIAKDKVTDTENKIDGIDPNTIDTTIDDV